MDTKGTNHAFDAEMSTMIIAAGVQNLQEHVQEVNDLNVFPIPDGDTGDNMLMTIRGAEKALQGTGDNTAENARAVANGMLLAARGNSGVILSQFFAGLAECIADNEKVNVHIMENAFRNGVKRAYSAVMTPTEGTILTVAREATEYACAQHKEHTVEFMDAFLEEAKRSLERTPDQLAVLKKAGVVDSGGAGLIYIIEGMRNALNGDVTAFRDLSKESHGPAKMQAPGTQMLNVDLFTADSELTLGYCTEVLVRLQNKKTDIANFKVDVVNEFLQTIGNSVVAFVNGSILKIHVHTKTPDKVLAFCQQYGEFLTVKVENMSLQNNNLPETAAYVKQEKTQEQEVKERVPYAVVAVCSGKGIQETFREMGADYIVDGGQSMNPSASDFIKAFDEVHADTILVFPNNSNVILAAQQAASLYTESDVRVIESKTIGDGYAALGMLNTDLGSTDEIVEELRSAMEGVITASVSVCSRDAEMDGLTMHPGQYIGFAGKSILAVNDGRADAAKALADRLDYTDHEVCILVRGRDSDEAEAGEIASYIEKQHRCEVYTIDGGQDIYSYILIVE